MLDSTDAVGNEKRVKAKPTLKEISDWCIETREERETQSIRGVQKIMKETVNDLSWRWYHSKNKGMIMTASVCGGIEYLEELDYIIDSTKQYAEIKKSDDYISKRMLDSTIEDFQPSGYNYPFRFTTTELARIGRLIDVTGSNKSSIITTLFAYGIINEELSSQFEQKTYQNVIKNFEFWMKDFRILMIERAYESIKNGKENITEDIQK